MPTDHSLLFGNCRQTEDSHVKTNFVHTLFRIQKYGLMPIEQFEDILTPSEMKKCKKSHNAKKTWYTLNLQVFTNFIFQVWTALPICFALCTLKWSLTLKYT